MFRRQGLAKKLLSIVEEKTKIKPTPQDPISPLGEKLFKINKQGIEARSGAPGNRTTLLALIFLRFSVIPRVIKLHRPHTYFVDSCKIFISYKLF